MTYWAQARPHPAHGTLSEITRDPYPQLSRGASAFDCIAASWPSQFSSYADWGAAPSNAAFGSTFVTLSGTVTQGGTPVSGINVRFNANGPGADSVTATTGSDGTYALHVIPGDVGVISFQMSTAQVGLPAANIPEAAVAISADYTVSAQDQTENLPLPTPTNVDVSVVDSDGTGLSGASVQSEGSTGNGTGQLSDGTPTIIQLSDYYPTCTTDSSGQCSIPDLVGIPLSIYANYSPQPGDTKAIRPSQAPRPHRWTPTRVRRR